MTHTWRPSISPWPVTTPSPGEPSGDGSMPRTGCCSASRPNSMNVPLSNSRSMRSRTVSLPFSCCLAIRWAPPMPRFFFLRACRSDTRLLYSSATDGNSIEASRAPDHQVGPIPPPIQEPVQVSARQPVAFGRLRRLPQAVLMLHHRQVRNDYGAAPVVAQAEAEVDVRDAIEAELRIEAAGRQRVGSPERHAVALDRIHVGAGAFLELLERVFGPHAERSGHDHRWIVERGEQRSDGIALQLDALVEQDADLAGGGIDAGVDRGAETERRVRPDDAKPLRSAAVQPGRDSLVARVVDDKRLEVSLAVREDREKPALSVGLPAVHDADQGHPTRRGGNDGGRLGAERTQLAAGRPVEQLPPGVVEPRSNRVGGLEVP